jgi:hypothetical protein
LPFPVPPVLRVFPATRANVGPVERKAFPANPDHQAVMDCPAMRVPKGRTDWPETLEMSERRGHRERMVLDMPKAHPVPRAKPEHPELLEMKARPERGEMMRHQVNQKKNFQCRNKYTSLYKIILKFLKFNLNSIFLRSTRRSGT